MPTTKKKTQPEVQAPDLGDLREAIGDNDIVAEHISAIEDYLDQHVEDWHDGEQGRAWARLRNALDQLVDAQDRADGALSDVEG